MCCAQHYTLRKPVPKDAHRQGQHQDAVQDASAACDPATLQALLSTRLVTSQQDLQILERQAHHLQQAVHWFRDEIRLLQRLITIQERKA